MLMVGKDGGLAHLIVTIGDDSIMKTRTRMATIPTDLETITNNMSSEEDEGKNAEQADPILIKWEEWALSAEEHYHALQKYRDNPRGRPMGHKA